MKAFFKNKGLAWYILAITSILSIIVSFIVFGTWTKWLPNNMVGTGFALLLLFGGFLGIAQSVFPLKFSALVQTLIYTIALGICISKTVNAIVDKINDVYYTGGSFNGCMVYLVSIFVLAISCVVATFFPITKDNSEII